MLRRFPWVMLAASLALLLLAPLGVAAQSQQLTVEGYSVLGNVVSTPIRASVPLTPPYRAVAAGPYFQIVDESSPAALTVVSQLGLPEPIQDMAVAGNNVFIADGYGGTLIVNAANVTAPYVTGSFATSDALAIALDSNGEFAYVANGDQTIQVLNVKDTSHPTKVMDKFFTNANFYDLVVAGQTLLAAGGGKGIFVYTIASPNSPSRVKRVKSLKACTSLAVQGQLVAALDGDLGLVLVSFPAWNTPAVESTLTLPNPGQACAFLPQDPTKLLVAEGDGGIQIIDVSNPAVPAVVASSATPSPCVGLSLSGSNPYAVCGDNGLWALNLSNPSQPTAQQVLEGEPGKTALVSTGSTAYVGSNSHLEVWDCTNSAHPVKVTSIPVAQPIVDMTLSGHLLFAACQTAGVDVFDISAPQVPTLLSTLPVTGSAVQVAVEGNLMAVAAGLQGLVLADISNPASPVTLSTWQYGKKATPGFVSGAAFSGATTVWVDHNIYGATALNVSAPAAPTIIGKESSASMFGKIYAYSNILYVCSEAGGLVPIDISNPAKPVKKTAVSTTYATSLLLDGDRALLCDGFGGLKEFDLTDPLVPAQVTLFSMPGYAYDVTVLPDGTRLVASPEGGLWSLALSPCDGVTLLEPCDGQSLSRITAPSFMWKAVAGAKYEVQLSTDPGFPKGKGRFLGTETGGSFKEPFWKPAGQAWKWIQKHALNGASLYWRVKIIQNKTTSISESRSFTLQ
ncbi:MAG: LVIVD repeat-containing protein [Acidobacteriota bacterium]